MTRIFVADVDGCADLVTDPFEIRDMLNWLGLIHRNGEFDFLYVNEHNGDVISCWGGSGKPTLDTELTELWEGMDTDPTEEDRYTNFDDAYTQAWGE